MNAAAIRRRARLLPALASQSIAPSSKTSALDIAEIRRFPVREPVSGAQYSLLRVKTRSGVTGWGECELGSDDQFKALESAWTGKPAHAYAAIALSMPLAGGLDIALLDILGKASNTPVYRLLGGPTRNKVRAFASPYAADFPITVIAIPVPASRNQGKAYQNQIRALVDAVPADHDFILAGNGLLTPGDAASVAATVESTHPLWFDEPCPYSNIDALRKVSGETVVPLGFGRGMRDPAIFQALLRDGLVDIVRPELACFGITGCKRIAALAEPYYVAVAPRHNGGPVASAAALHLAAAIPNFFAQNLPLPAARQDREMRIELLSQDVEAPRNGFLELPGGPGLGITVNEAALEKYHAA